MELALSPRRSVMMLAVGLAAALALMPLVMLAAGAGANDLIEACRSFMGSFAGVMPCATRQ
jgi:hypothetical protein